MRNSQQICVFNIAGLEQFVINWERQEWAIVPYIYVRDGAYWGGAGVMGYSENTVSQEEGTTFQMGGGGEGNEETVQPRAR